MKKIATINIPEGITSIDVFMTSSGLYIDFARSNESASIGDVIGMEVNGEFKPMYILQKNINPYRSEIIQQVDLHKSQRGYWSLKVDDFTGMGIKYRVANEREKLATLWDLENECSLVWDEAYGRLINKNIHK
ncbi:hypothetical protein E2605_07515 [Dysgonomonas capnocytophagoides]|uniref:Uncharacterized protein n=1 Tax=Dysgonomonas capnocytophagoides TaxID=45254 RepID=A0A4Y8L1W4_9BACT|nr:hypothetical protein [Dysgonomonas capnocytophagoides]TFD96659.1 hypothetical protein E2605_07515 [Dysgonomonas capnocytophagoides]